MGKNKKIKVGRVVSNKMDKTVVVAVESYRHHPVYKKTVRTTKRYKAHDEKNTCGIGDTVSLVETRPLSREKRWRVIEIMNRAELVEIRPEEIDIKAEEPEVEAEEKPEEKPEE